MCGVLAIFDHGSRQTRSLTEPLVAARDMMAHRGPDAAGVWISDDGRVGLAHRRLSIIDTAAASNQPLVSADGSLIISYNGEIYNYQELRRELLAAGHVFRTKSDTEVILNLYRQYGISGLSRMRGMFAFALWDDNAKGLLLARDGFGIKPLYITDNGKTLAAASEFRSLRSYLADSVTPDIAGQVAFFLRGCMLGEFTPIKEIRSLAPGSWLWRDRNGTKQGRYFDPVHMAQSAEDQTLIAPKDIIERRHELGDALADSVRHHLVADVPVGVFLSAGVDSSAIAALLPDDNDQERIAITLGVNSYKGTLDDEVPASVEVAGTLGFDHHVFWLNQSDFTDEADAIIKAMDLPSIDGINTYFVAKAAAANGLKVALSGLGGDELFAGYPSFSQIPRLVTLTSPFGRARKLGRLVRHISAPLISRLTSPKYASLFEYGHSPAGAIFLRRGLFMPWELDQAVDSGTLAVALDTLGATLGFEGRYDEIRSPTLQVGLMEMELYMQNQLLRDSDWAGMAHSLEIRVPLVDTELFGRLLPLMAADQAITKADVGQILGGVVQAAVERPKTGFGLPIRGWVMEHYGLCDRGIRSWALLLFDKWCKANNVPNAMEGMVVKI
jgi:asparagine synthase (glutamine-hydrolysing)